MITATRLRVCRRLWTLDTRDVAGAHLPASLATEGRRARILSRPLASHPPILRQRTMQPSWRTPSLMIPRASGRTLRLAPGAPSLRLTRNGTVSVATRATARSLLGATRSGVPSMLARQMAVMQVRGTRLGRGLRRHPTLLMLLLHPRGAGRVP